ncbi:MAG: IS5/IS1182 family transposase [Bacteroidetes bacterium]|nr:MAG: IS5/IS1182 family transposase [Bacteroidota bacterium]
MSLRKQSLGPVPEDTARVARKAFKKGNLYIKIADELGEIYDFTDFIELFPEKGQSAKHPVRLLLATTLQFAEGLSDREAAEAVRSRIDWKYFLRLDLDDAGFDYTLLAEFRKRLLYHDKAHALLDKLIAALKERGLIKSRGKQRTDSTHVLAAIRELNRLEFVHETMRSTLESLAVAAEAWVTEVIPGEWYQRYGRRLFSFNSPKTEKEREKLACTIAEDGWNLLRWIDEAHHMSWLSEIPAVVTLRAVWDQQFTKPPSPPRFLNQEEQLPAAERIASPHDTDARFSIKKDLEWAGYKVHLTETCDEGLPRLITNVETTVATQPDWLALPAIHDALDSRAVIPADHMADTGYVSVANILDSRQTYGVRLIGPGMPDNSWQALTGGYDTSYFKIDWEAQTATCPNGKVSRSWTPEKNGYTEVSFRPSDCYRCHYREICVQGTTKAGHPKARHLHLRPREEFEVLEKARKCLKNEETKKLYMQRAGIEGTISQAVRSCGTRTARYRGFAKVRLEHVLTALALNFTKLGEWLLGTPLAKTRKSHLQLLKSA